MEIPLLKDSEGKQIKPEHQLVNQNSVVNAEDQLHIQFEKKRLNRLLESQRITNNNNLPEEYKSGTDFEELPLLGDLNGDNNINIDEEILQRLHQGYLSDYPDEIYLLEQDEIDPNTLDALGPVLAEENDFQSNGKYYEGDGNNNEPFYTREGI